jgi:hypothetical protein
MYTDPFLPVPRRATFWQATPRAVLLGLMCLAGFGSAQAVTTLKSLVDGHGSLVAGDVTFTNFRTPIGVAAAFVDVRSYGLGDDVAVRSEAAADGSVRLVFTPVDRTTGTPTPAFIDAANGAAASPNQAYNVTYDVVVTNTQRKLHAVDSWWGSGTSSSGATEAVNAVYYFSAGGGNSVCGCFVYLDQFRGTQFVSGRPAGGALLPQVETWSATPGTGDYSAYRFGNQWGLISGPWGGVRIGQASLDNLTLSFTLVAAAPPIGVPQLANLFPDAVYLSAPAGAGGTTVALSSSDTSLAVVPASITVPAGAMYAPIPIVDGPVPFPAYASISGSLNGATRTALYEVWPAVWPPAGPPQPSLSITRTGSGTVSSADKKIACGSKCSVTYAAGTVVSLTAQPASNNRFVGWGGACTGTALTCSTPVSDPGMNAIAMFETVAAAGGGGSSVTLRISVANLGTVISDVGGINCGSVCSAKYAQSSAVTLSAVPPAGKTFVNWGGACTGTAPVCSLTVGSNLSVQANFSK